MRAPCFFCFWSAQVILPGLYCRGCIAGVVWSGLYGRGCIAGVVLPGLYGQGCMAGVVLPGLYGRGCIVVWPGLYGQGFRELKVKEWVLRSNCVICVVVLSSVFV